MNTTQTHNSALLLPQSQTLIMRQGERRTFSCMELGTCQSRKPACAGCTVHDYPEPRKPINFAPGVIQRLPRQLQLSSRLRRQALLIVAWLAIFLGAMMLAGFLARKLGLV